MIMSGFLARSDVFEELEIGSEEGLETGVSLGGTGGVDEITWSCRS